ncbi:hypothetical protein J6590_075804 [Homalodisca vitripennis]|nr:hypothetical protein J6590_075804 [Homalodisca vitripennis]
MLPDVMCLGVSDVETLQGVCLERLRRQRFVDLFRQTWTPDSSSQSVVVSDFRRCTKCKVNWSQYSHVSCTHIFPSEPHLVPTNKNSLSYYNKLKSGNNTAAIPELFPGRRETTRPSTVMISSPQFRLLRLRNLSLSFSYIRNRTTRLVQKPSAWN